MTLDAVYNEGTGGQDESRFLEYTENMRSRILIGHLNAAQCSNATYMGSAP